MFDFHASPEMRVPNPDLHLHCKIDLSPNDFRRGVFIAFGEARVRKNNEKGFMLKKKKKKFDFDNCGEILFFRN